MAKKNDDFFLEKKAWSVVKDELLGCYFKPYVSKILHTMKMTLKKKPLTIFLSITNQYRYMTH